MGLVYHAAARVRVTGLYFLGCGGVVVARVWCWLEHGQQVTWKGYALVELTALRNGLVGAKRAFHLISNGEDSARLGLGLGLFVAVVGCHSG
jgi:hypothetical protein